jgi:Zn-dependent metalloprotease
MKKFLFTVLGIVLCCAQIYAFDVSPTQVNTDKKVNPQVKVNPDLIKKLFNSKSFSNGIEMLIVTDDGERISSIRGELSSPLSGVESALEYIRENAAVFNLPVDRDVEILRPVKNEKFNKVNHLSFQMMIDGVAVNEARIDLHTDKDGVVVLANGSLPTIDEITNQIVIGKYQAIGAAKTAIEADKFRAVPQAQLQILPCENKTGKMVYVTRIAVENPLGDWEILIDAETGEALRVNNEMAFRESHNGKGQVFVTNPLICDASIETLYHLTANTLTGLYCRVVNEDTDESVNENNEHIYDTDNTHFDEAGMYNYITTIHDYYKRVHGHDKLDKPMRATVHLGTNYDNAYFSPWQGAFAFGDGDKFNNLAREASVAFHEYSHAVINSITYLAYSGESGAINEGQADYFGCTVTDDAKIGEWVTNKMDRPYLRNLENDLHYPEDIHGEVHADGKIWGALLWDIRKAIGREKADKVIYRSHYYLNGSRPTFMDGFNALITADKNLFDGENKEAITRVCENRGVVAKSYNGAVLTADDLNNKARFLKLHKEM